MKNTMLKLAVVVVAAMSLTGCANMTPVQRGALGGGALGTAAGAAVGAAAGGVSVASGAGVGLLAGGLVGALVSDHMNHGSADSGNSQPVQPAYVPPAPVKRYSTIEK